MFLCSFMVLWSSFAKKLMSLLSIEMGMVCLIYLFMSFNHGTHQIFFFCLLLCIFLVVDSVLGVSMLICFSRSSHGSPSLSVV